MQYAVPWARIADRPHKEAYDDELCAKLWDWLDKEVAAKLDPMKALPSTAGTSVHDHVQFITWHRSKDSRSPYEGCTQSLPMEAFVLRIRVKES